MNQRTMLVAEMLREGNLADAQDIIEMELDDRSEELKTKVQEAMVGKILESSISKNVSGLGKVSLNRNSIILHNVKSYDEALKIAPKFAAHVDNFTSTKKDYNVKRNNDNETITIMDGNKEFYDIFYNENDNTIEYEGLMLDGSDVQYFKKNGQLPEQ